MPRHHKRRTVAAAALVSLLSAYATSKLAVNHWSQTDALILLGFAVSFWHSRRL